MAKEQNGASLLEQAVKETGYTRIDIVKIAYMEYLAAKRQAQVMQDMQSEKLPKHRYGKRKNGVKKKFGDSAIKFGSRKDKSLQRSFAEGSKYLEMFKKMLSAQQNMTNLYQRFEALAKQLTPEEQQSIISGQEIPVNVMAKAPRKQSIVTQINSSGSQKINVRTKVA